MTSASVRPASSAAASAAAAAPDGRDAAGRVDPGVDVRSSPAASTAYHSPSTGRTTRADAGAAEQLAVERHGRREAAVPRAGFDRRLQLGVAVLADQEAASRVGTTGPGRERAAELLDRDTDLGDAGVPRQREQLLGRRARTSRPGGRRSWSSAAARASDVELGVIGESADGVG